VLALFQYKKWRTSLIMLKKILSLIIFILVVFAAYLLFNTFTFQSKQIHFESVKKIPLNDSIGEHLSEAIQIKTVSHENTKDFDSVEFEAFSRFLTDTYPLTHQKLEKSIINQYSMLFKWSGSNETLSSVFLVAHLDVVPVPDNEIVEWSVPPFSGEIIDGVLWGRGALDDKVSVIGILEAVEYLLEQGHEPVRTFYLAFGHDEEVGGLNGARQIVAHLKSQGIQPEFVLDEGYSITQGLVPGVLTDVALIGIAEKGFASLNMSVEMDGGHSSMPGKETAIETIAAAITRLQANPLPAEICAPVQQFIEHVGPETRFQEKLVFSNNKLFKKAILSIYQKSGPGRAVVQTTMAPTIFNSGIKDNVIPSSASATINFRILPGTSISEVISHVKKSINDERIKIELKDFHSEPSKVSSTESKGYSLINQSIKEIYPDVITVPNLVLAATDGRYYGEICADVYRFSPIKLTQDNINTIHGIDELIPVDEFRDAIRFYVQLIKNCN
jgi:carboxypeptidase PM20D1